MSKVMITESYLEDIADAIRTKNGSSDTYKPAEMADAIDAIPAGSASPNANVTDFFAFVPAFDNTWTTTTFSLISYPTGGVLSIPHSLGAIPDYVVILKTDLTSDDVGGIVGGYNFISGAKTDSALNRNLSFHVPTSPGTGYADLPSYGFYGQISPTNWNLVGNVCAEWTSTELSIRVGTSKSNTYGFCLGEYIVGMKKVS